MVQTETLPKKGLQADGSDEALVDFEVVDAKDEYAGRFDKAPVNSMKKYF